MSSPAGSFLTGLLGGTIQSSLAASEKKHKEDLDNEANHFRILHDAFQTAVQRGDAPAIAHILRTTEEMQQNSLEGKTGGKAKAAKGKQQGIMSTFADMIEGGKPTGGMEPTPEATQATEANKELAPLDQTRPRVATQPELTKPLFQSNEELAARELEAQEKKLKALEPYKLREIEARSQASMRADAEKQRIRSEYRMQYGKMLQEGRENLDLKKTALAIKASAENEGTPISDEEAQARAGAMITQERQGKMSLINARQTHMASSDARSDKRLEDMIRHHKAIEDHLKVIEGQANRRLSQGDQRLLNNAPELKGYIEQAKNLRGKAAEYGKAMRQAYAIMNNPLQTDPTVLAEARKTYDNAEMQKSQIDEEMATNLERFKTKAAAAGMPLVEEEEGGEGKSLTPKTPKAPGKSLKKASTSYQGAIFPASALQKAAAEAFPGDRDGVNKLRKELANRKVVIAEDQ